MAIYKVQGPNGEIIEIEGPENANPNDVIAQAQSLYQPQQAAATPAKQDTVFSSTGLPAKAMGAFETGLSALSGALAVPASAAAGIYGTLTSGKYGTQEGIREGDKLARQVQERMTYRPTTQAGQDIAESAAKVLEASKLPPMIAGPTGIVGLNGAGPAGAFKQGAQRATQIAGNTAMFVPEVAAGALGRGGGVIVEPGAVPKSYQVASQRNKVGDSFVEPREFSTFEQGRLPYGQLPAEVPIGNLTANPIDKAALIATGGSVPNAGRGARAFGERIGETYRNPFYAAADIASMFNPVFPGLPLITAGKAGMGAVQALADMRLASKGFTPNLPQILDEYKTGARPMPRPMPGPEGPMPPMQQFSPGPMPAAGAVRPQTPQTPQTMAAAQINPAAAVTPAAQAAVATTQAKVQQPTTAAVPQRPVGQNVNIPQETGPIKPAPEASIQKMSSIVGNDPAILRSASLEEHAKALYNHYKSVGAPIDKRTAKTLAKQEMAAYNKSQSDAAAAQQQAAVDAKRAADQAAYDASPIGQSVKAVNQQLADNPNLLNDSKIVVATPSNIERVKRAIEPHENTPVIKQALKEKVEANPNLTGFDQPYVIPQAVKQQVQTFLKSTFGDKKNLIAVGEGGTGKSSLALQWKRENPDGQLNKVTKLGWNADELNFETTINRNADKQLYLIDEVDQFTPQQIDQLENLINAKPRAKFLFTTNKPDKIPALIEDYPQVSLNIKLTPEERSAFALNVAEKFNVNKTTAEIEKIAQNPSITNFADLKKEISKGYTLKETPIKIASENAAASRMPDTPTKITDELDALANNELPRNAIIFDKSAKEADPDILDKLRRYTGPALDTDIPSLKKISNQILEGNSVLHRPPELIIVNKNNIDRVEYLKAELEISNDTTHPVNFIFYDPQNLLTTIKPGEKTAPMARRAHVIDSSYFEGQKTAPKKEAFDEGAAYRENWGTAENYLKYFKNSPENEKERILKLAFPEYKAPNTKGTKDTGSEKNSIFETFFETPKPAATPKPKPAATPKPEPAATPKPATPKAEPKYDSPSKMRQALYKTMPDDELEALIKRTFPK